MAPPLAQILLRSSFHNFSFTPRHLPVPQQSELHAQLSVNSLLHVRVHLDHVLVQLRVLAHHDLGIPSCSDKDSLDTRLQRCCKAVGDLQADEESVGDDDWSKAAVAIVGWVGEDQVEVGKAVRFMVSGVLSWVCS